MVEAKVWRKATRNERLVGDVAIQMRSKTLKTAASILIATWLDELMAQRRSIQRGKKENIITNWTDPEELRDADERFKKNIQSLRIIITNGQKKSWGTSCGHVNRGTS